MHRDIASPHEINQEKQQTRGNEHACINRVALGNSLRGCGFCTFEWVLRLIDASDWGRKKNWKKRKDQRRESEVRGDREGESEQWCQTEEHWSSDGCCPLTIRAFEGGRRGGASCWQCQGRYQLASASATETNDWATALLYVCHRQMYSGGPNSYIFSILCWLHSQQVQQYMQDVIQQKPTWKIVN